MTYKKSKRIGNIIYDLLIAHNWRSFKQIKTLLEEERGFEFKSFEINKAIDYLVKKGKLTSKREESQTFYGIKE
jgi:hypothetical protein